jgi:hypothetical protein
LRRVVRRASPVVAQRVSAHAAATGRGERRALEQGKGRAAVVTAWWREPAVEPRRVSSADNDVDDRSCDDDHRAACDHDDGTAGAGADDHDDETATAAAPDHDDHCATAPGCDEQ